MTAPKPELRRAVERALGWRPTAWRVVSGRGYTATERWLAGDGRRSVFVKAAVDELTAGWLRAERRVYGAVSGSFMPLLLGADDDWPFLLLEDLSAADWPPPWTPARIEAVLETLDEVAIARPDLALEPAEAMRTMLDGWPSVAEDPRPLLSLRLCDRRWLDRVLPTLAEASASAPLAGDDLLHLDVRSDNLCFADGTVRLIDWNWAVRGDRRFDVAAWLPSLTTEGGPFPTDVVGPGYGSYAALLAGFWATHAPTPPPATAAPVRELQRRTLAVALSWAAQDLGLPPPSAR